MSSKWDNICDVSGGREKGAISFQVKTGQAEKQMKDHLDRIKRVSDSYVTDYPNKRSFFELQAPTTAELLADTVASSCASSTSRLEIHGPDLDAAAVADGCSCCKVMTIPTHGPNSTSRNTLNYRLASMEEAIAKAESGKLKGNGGASSSSSAALASHSPFDPHYACCFEWQGRPDTVNACGCIREYKEMCEFAGLPWEASMAYDEFGRIQRSDHRLTRPIVECGAGCCCEQAEKRGFRWCRNRVVKRGRDPDIMLAIRPTEHRGLGLFYVGRTSDPHARLHRGTFVGCYIGELVTEDRGNDYLLDIDTWFQYYAGDASYKQLSKQEKEDRKAKKARFDADLTKTIDGLRLLLDDMVQPAVAARALAVSDTIQKLKQYMYVLRREDESEDKANDDEYRSFVWRLAARLLERLQELRKHPYRPDVIWLRWIIQNYTKQNEKPAAEWDRVCADEPYIRDAIDRLRKEVIDKEISEGRCLWMASKHAGRKAASASTLFGAASAAAASPYSQVAGAASGLQRKRRIDDDGDDGEECHGEVDEDDDVAAQRTLAGIEAMRADIARIRLLTHGAGTGEGDDLSAVPLSYQISTTDSQGSGGRASSRGGALIVFDSESCDGTPVVIEPNSLRSLLSSPTPVAPNAELGAEPASGGTSLYQPLKQDKPSRKRIPSYDAGRTGENLDEPARDASNAAEPAASSSAGAQGGASMRSPARPHHHRHQQQGAFARMSTGRSSSITSGAGGAGAGSSLAAPAAAAVDVSDDEGGEPYADAHDYHQVLADRSTTTDKGKAKRLEEGRKQYQRIMRLLCSREMTIDPKSHHGNFAQFVNSSCNPNLAMVPVYTDIKDCSLPYLALFTGRDVQPGEELTWDYGKEFVEQLIRKWGACRCGASICIGANISLYGKTK